MPDSNKIMNDNLNLNSKIILDRKIIVKFKIIFLANFTLFLESKKMMCI